MRGWIGLALGSAAWLYAAAGTAVEAQDLAARVLEAPDGWVTFQVDVAEGVEICDRGVRVRDPESGRQQEWHRNGPNTGECVPGPMQVELETDSDRILRIRARKVRPLDGARSLGAVDPVEASRFLVGLAYLPAAAEAAEAGFALSRLPRGADPAPGILRAARDRELPSRIRKSALFWAGQMAADEVVGPLKEAATEDPDQDVREAAVFALSQHLGSGAVPSLMELATEAPHPGTRRAALFWLAQRDEPEVVDFLSELILGRSGG